MTTRSRRCGDVVGAFLRCYNTSMTTPASPVSALSGVGPTVSSKLKRLGVTTIKDLLWHVPFRYEDWRLTVPVSDLKIGQRATIRATVALIANRRSLRRRMTITEALVTDDSGSMKVIWFNQGFLTRNLA